MTSSQRTQSGSDLPGCCGVARNCSCCDTTPGACHDLHVVGVGNSSSHVENHRKPIATRVTHVDGRLVIRETVTSQLADVRRALEPFSLPVEVVIW